MNITPGSHLGRYEIRAPLGAGGMGEVWVAYDHDLDREVAIKVLRDGASSSSDSVRRFVQEAKAASALNHPNVAHIYEIGAHDDVRFIVMEIVAGETLRARIARGPLPAGEALDIALQVTAALAAAHGAGIVHRDIKPENIIIRPDGYAKVLDFGLAKLREQSPSDSSTAVRTGTGMAMGTIGYMAPEQFISSDVTASADVYSLGVVLFEMVHGHRPGDPALPASPLGPRTFDEIIQHATAKKPDDRYPSAAGMLEDLKRISRETVIASAAAPRGVSRMWVLAASLLLIAAIAGGVMFAMRARRQRDARQMIARAELFVAQRRYPDAYELATRASASLPDDDRLLDVISRVTQKVSIRSDPSGATVYVQRFKGPPERERLGTTPLDFPRFLRADYIVTVEKDGYAPATRPLSIAPIWGRDLEFARMPGTLQIKLIEAGRVPPRMVFVSGGPYRLQGWSRPSDREVDLHDFFIDRYEVSNRDYDEFVRAGGYRRPEYWKELPGQAAALGPLVPDPPSKEMLRAGGPRSEARGPRPEVFRAAMARFVDSTGLPGPRSWAGGVPPAGRENDPVTDITWYEAAAFAEWSGKLLPTIYQWERAGRYPGTRGAATSFPWGFVAEGVDVTERANFLGKGTVPVDSMPFGMSTWGAQNMAGNVSEWLRNEKPPGHGARGGSWNDATYAYGKTASFPLFYASSTLGFRCVKQAVPGEDGGFALAENEVVPAYQPVDDRTYNELRKRYDYARTPLDAKVVETRNAPDWTREKIAFDVAGRKVIAYLYLPRGYKPPFQVIDFAPAGDVESGLRSLASSIEARLAPHIRSGRAIFSVAMEGTIDRPRTTQFEEPDSRSSEYVDYAVSRVTELRRGLDYLETRPEIDRSRIAFEADSAGVWSGVILAAVDPRFRSVMFVGSGIEPRERTDAEAGNRINFLPHMSAPKLMLQGRYDESSPYASAFEPLYNLLRQPKRAVIFEGPHVPPAAVYLRESQKWFDETLGKGGG